MFYKGQVRNGRLVVDEPTDLPEGEEVLLAPIDEEDELTPEDEEDIRGALAQIDRGEVVSAGEVHAAMKGMLAELARRQVG